MHLGDDCIHIQNFDLGSILSEILFYDDVSLLYCTFNCHASKIRHLPQNASCLSDEKLHCS